MRHADLRPVVAHAPDADERARRDAEEERAVAQLMQWGRVGGLAWLLGGPRGWEAKTAEGVTVEAASAGELVEKLRAAWAAGRTGA